MIFGALLQPPNLKIGCGDGQDIDGFWCQPLGGGQPGGH